MTYLRLLMLGLLIVCASWSSGASAHPHVWVTMQTEVLFSPDKSITGLRNRWTFDDAYTSFAVDGLNGKGKGMPSEAELKDLAETNIEALKEFEYFTFVFMGETKVPMKTPIDYHLDYQNKLLTLTFTMPLENPVAYNRIKDFSFAVYDPGMYVAMAFTDKEPVKIASAKPLPCTPSVGDRRAKAKTATTKEITLGQLGENIDPSSNLGFQYAERVTLACKP